MNQIDKGSLEVWLKELRGRYQVLSHKIHWSDADSACLDNLMNLKEQQRDISSRIARVTAPWAASNIFPSFLAYKAWQRTKAVYCFNRTFFDAVKRTEDTSIRTSLLDTLPFKDMMFYFPEGTLPKINNEETAGMFVHLEKHPEHLWVWLNYFDRTNNKGAEIYPGISFAFPLTNGMKISQVFETSNFLEWLPVYKRTLLFDRNLNEQEAEECLLAEKETLNTAIILLYYLSAENADIMPIKQPKKPRKSFISSKEDDAPNVKLHEVGSKYEEEVIIYRRNNKPTESSEENLASSEEDKDNSDEETTVHSSKSKKRRRPHARRAHYQHYHVGKGREIEVVRWKSDIFVGVNRDDQAVIVHDIVKDSLKGKRNKNTRKKKRDR